MKIFTGNNRSGFTLMEIMLAVACLMLLLGGVFSIASSTIQLTGEISAEQELSMKRGNFIDWCRRALRELPAQAQLRLEVDEIGSGRYESRLWFENIPSEFLPGVYVAGEGALILFTRHTIGGYLRAGLQHVGEEDLSVSRKFDLDAGQRLYLVDELTQFEWRFYDGNSQTWNTVWELEQGRPQFAELTISYSGEEARRHVFWIPPLVKLPAPAPPGETEEQSSEDTEAAEQ